MDVKSDRVAWFLENACPDHHVRGPSDHNEARHIAARILRRDPWIAEHSFGTAVVCGNVDYVRRALAERPELATQPIEQGNPERGNSGGRWDRYKYKSLGPKGWEPLLHLCFTRLPIKAVEENALEIARLLLDKGANPNAWFRAGDSSYTPLTGVIGEGEEDRPGHQRRDELTRLLLERGAEPYDEQVLYNIHFHGKVLWYFRLMYEFSLKLGRRREWDDPTWSMLPMGVYGPGASFWFTVAAQKNDMELAQWMIDHGASPTTPVGSAWKKWSSPPHEVATRHGHLKLAELLARHGAARVENEGTEIGRCIAACMKLDRDEVRARLEANPEYVRKTDSMFAAARANRRDVAELLLDLGMSPDVENEKKERPLHIAAYEDAVRVGALLIERGAEIDPIELNYNNTPIDAATYMQARGMIELLGRHSRDLFYLVYTGRVERVRELLAEDPELIRKTKDSHTLLLWLPPDDEQRAMELARLLLAHGAKPTGTAYGLTTAEYIEKLELPEVARLLREFEAHANSP